MPFVLIQHEVESFPAWKTEFDAAAALRKVAGEISFQLLVHAANPRLVVHFSAWSSLDAARRFFESPEVHAIRQRAGVKAPEFCFLDEVEQGVL
jgi:quinol monooxygenase YgiN